MKPLQQTYHRPPSTLFIQTIPNNLRFCIGHEQFQELIVDCILDIDA